MCCLFTFSLVMAETPKQWTLKECIDYALANNIQLQQKKITKSESTEDVKQAKATLFPSLSFSTSQQLGYQPFKRKSEHCNKWLCGKVLSISSLIVAVKHQCQLDCLERNKS